MEHGSFLFNAAAVYDSQEDCMVSATQYQKTRGRQHVELLSQPPDRQPIESPELVDSSPLPARPPVRQRVVMQSVTLIFFFFAGAARA